MSSPWCQDPGQRELGGASPFWDRHLLDPRPRVARFRSKLLALEARVDAAKVVLRRSPRVRLKPAGQEAAAERAVGDEADAELAHGGEDLVLERRASTSEYSVCSAVIGWTAWARADRLGRGLGEAEVAHLARVAPARPSRRPSPRSASRDRRGAGSRGRCGRRRAAAASRRTPRARSSGRPSIRARSAVGRRARCRTSSPARPRRGGRRSPCRPAPRW